MLTQNDLGPAPAKTLEQIDAELSKVSTIRLLAKTRGEDRPATSLVNGLLDERLTLTGRPTQS